MFSVSQFMRWMMRGGEKVCVGEVLRAAEVELYWHRYEVKPDFAAISEKTGISLDALGEAWEIVRVPNNN